MGKIYAIAGRKGAGKTATADTLIDQGFIKLSFADYLRATVAKLYDLNINQLKDPSLKEKEFTTPLIWNENTCKELSSLVNLDLSNHEHHICVFKNPRHALQFIGTDILKAKDKLFHVKQTAKSIDPNLNYVIDDIRFPEEKEVLANLPKTQLTSIFILRPSNWNISNHISEYSLKWNMFDNLIINDGSVEKLIGDFHDICSNKKFAQFTYKNTSFSEVNSIHAQWAGFVFGAKNHDLNLKYIKIRHHDYYIMSFLCDFLSSNYIYPNPEQLEIIPIDGLYELKITSPFILENLKYWYPDNQEHIEPKLKEAFNEGFNMGLTNGKSA